MGPREGTFLSPFLLKPSAWLAQIHRRVSVIAQRWVWHIGTATEDGPNPWLESKVSPLDGNSSEDRQSHSVTLGKSGQRDSFAYPSHEEIAENDVHRRTTCRRK